MPQYQPSYASYGVQTTTTTTPVDDTLQTASGDTTLTRMVVSLTLQPTTGGLTAVTTLDSLILQSRDTTIQALNNRLRTTSYPVFLTPAGHLQPDQPTIAAPCDSTSPPLMIPARAFVIPLLDTLTMNSTWTDSTSAITCRRNRPIAVDIVTTYHLVGNDPRSSGIALLIHRESELRYTMADSASVTILQLSGTGTSTGTAVIDSEHGTLLSAVDTIQARISVQAGGKTMTFVQQALRTMHKRP